MTKTTTVRLTLDAVIRAKLDELADFHGESAEGTLCLLIHHGRL